MNLGQFHTAVSTEINRGTAHDSLIPSYVRRSVQWLERNYSLKYMERFVSFTIDPSAAQPRVLPLPSRPKSISFMRIVKDDGSLHYLTQIDPREISHYETTVPSHYWLDGDEFIWLGDIPAETYSAELSYVQYSEWEESNSSFTHWLLDRADDWLLSATLVRMGGVLRNPELAKFHKPLADEALRTLLLADEEMQHSNRNYQMGFGVNYGAQ